MKLGFIGAGNMAGAIIKGFVNKNCVNSSDIYFIRQNKEKTGSTKNPDRPLARRPLFQSVQCTALSYLRE